MNRKGIILAGGSGTRLSPITNAISKQLIPIFDKPMIYYALSTMMQAQIRDILIISTPRDTPIFKQLLGNGNRWGINLEYATQPQPEGIAQAFIIGEKFINNHNSALILGDNIFHSHHFQELIFKASQQVSGATVFAKAVEAPQSYGVIELNYAGNILSIEEKPLHPRSNLAITGLYFYDNNVTAIAKDLKPSARKELEITDINKQYCKINQLNVEVLPPDVIWFDAGTHESILDAANCVAKAEVAENIKIACPEAIAWKNGWIDDQSLEQLASSMLHANYAEYLISLLTCRDINANHQIVYT